MATKKDYLREEIRHIDIKSLDVSHLIDAYRDMAFSARDLARAADYYNMMLEDKKLLRYVMPCRIIVLSRLERCCG